VGKTLGTAVSVGAGGGRVAVGAGGKVTDDSPVGMIGTDSNSDSWVAVDSPWGKDLPAEQANEAKIKTINVKMIDLRICMINL
jgi:hypothetical protein